MTDYFDEYDSHFAAKDYSGTTKAALPSRTGYALDSLLSRIGTVPGSIPDYARLHAQDQVSYSPFSSPGGAVGGATTRAYQAPGPPQRFNVNLLGEPTSPLMAAVGSAPGQFIFGTPGAQRGGSIQPWENGPPIATAPVNFANFATWAREAPLAAVTALLGRNYQQSATPYAPGAGPENPDNIFENIAQGDLPNILDNFIDGVGEVANVANAVMMAPHEWARKYDASNRGMSIRDLVKTGTTPGSFLARILSTTDQSRFDWSQIAAKADARDIKVEDMAAELWDMDADIVRQIQANPDMTDEQIDALTEGQPFSYNADVDFILNLGWTVLPMLAVGAASGGTGFVADAAALLPRAAFMGLRGAAGAYEGARGLEAGALAARTWVNLEKLGLAGRPVATGEWLGSWSLMKAWRPIQMAALGLEKANRYSLMAGTGLRAGEWMLKQAAVIGGNEEASHMMDEWLWEMPLSNNPGMMMIDAFAVHPLRTAKANIHRAPGSVTARVFGAVHGVDVSAPLAIHLGTIRDMPLSTIQEHLFDKLGFDAATMERATGADSPLSLTDYKNGLMAVSLQVVRSRHPESAYLAVEGSPAARDAAFFAQYGDEAGKVLASALTGHGPDANAIVEALKLEFWTRRNTVDASEIGSIGSIGPYNGEVAFKGFTAWIHASKAFQVIADEAVPALREDLPRGVADAIREEFGAKYKPTTYVSANDLNRVRQLFPGIVKVRGGEVMKGVEGVKTKVTWRRLQQLISEGEADRRIRDLEAGEPGRDIIRSIHPDDATSEKALAVAFKLRQDTVRALLSGEIPEGTPIPSDLAKIIHDVYRTSEADMRRNPEGAWKRAQMWWEKVYQTALLRGQAVADIGKITKVMEDRLPADKTGALAEAMTRIRSVLDRPYKDMDPNNDGQNAVIASRNTEINLFHDRVAKWIDDPARHYQTFARGETRYLTDEALTPTDVALIESLREQAIGFTEGADSALLADPLAHPLELAPALQAAIEKGMPINELQKRMVGELHGIDDLSDTVQELLGEDTPTNRDTVQKATDKVTVHEAELHAIAEQAKGLAGLVDRSPKKNLSPELSAILDRARSLFGFHKIGKGGSYETWTQMPISSHGVTVASNAVENAKLRTRLESTLAAKEAELERANAIADRASAKVPPSEADIAWEEASLAHGTRKAMLEAAKEHQAAGYATIVRKTRDGRFDLYRGTLKEAGAEAPVPAVPDVPVPEPYANKMPPPRVETPPGGRTHEQIMADGQIDSDLVRTYVDPGLLARTNDIARQMARTESARTEFVVVQRAASRDGGESFVAISSPPGHREFSAFGKTPDEAVAGLQAKLATKLTKNQTKTEAPTPAPDAPGPAIAPEVAGTAAALTREQREASYRQSPDYTGTHVDGEGRGIMYAGTLQDSEAGFPKLRSDVEFMDDRWLGEWLNGNRGGLSPVGKAIIQAEIDRRAGVPAGTPQTIVAALDDVTKAHEAALELHAQGQEAGQRALEQRAQQYRDGSIEPGGSDPLYEIRKKLELIGLDDQEAYDALRAEYGSDAVNAAEQAGVAPPAKAPAAAPKAAVQPLSATAVKSLQRKLVAGIAAVDEKIRRARESANTPEEKAAYQAFQQEEYRTSTVLQGMGHGIETGRWDAQLTAAITRLEPSALAALVKRVVEETRDDPTIGTASSWFNEHFDELVNPEASGGGWGPIDGRTSFKSKKLATEASLRTAQATGHAVRVVENAPGGARGWHVEVENVDQVKGGQARPAPQPAWTQFLDPADNATPIPTRMILVDAANVITSSEDGFPANLQPRSRDIRASSDTQIARMAKDLQPDKLMGVTEGADGTPVVTPEGVVLAGNGRTEAIRRASTKEYAKYRAKVEAEAVKYGFTPEDVAALERPVLVREVDPSIDVVTLERLSWQLNRGMPTGDLIPAVARDVPVARLRAVEIGDAQPIREALKTAGNYAAAQAIIDTLPVDWRATYFEPNVGLNKDGLDLVEGLFLSKILRADDRSLPGFDDARALVFNMVESADNDIQRITSALTSSAGQVVNGIDRSPEIAMMADDLVPAMRQVMEFRQQGMTFADIRIQLQNVGMFAEHTLTPMQQRLAEVLAHSDSVPEIRKFLLRASEAGTLGEEGATAMFAEMTLDYPAVLNEGLKAWNAMRTEAGKPTLLPFPEANAPFDMNLTGNRETVTGETTGPVKLSQPLTVEDVEAEIVTRTGGQPTVDVYEGIRDGSRSMDDVEGRFQVVPDSYGRPSQYADPNAATAAADYLADPAGVRAEVAELMDTFETFQDHDDFVIDFLQGLIDDVSAGTHTAAEWIVLEHLVEIRRNFDGELNMRPEVIPPAVPMRSMRDPGTNAKHKLVKPLTYTEEVMASLDRLDRNEDMAKAVDEARALGDTGTTAESALSRTHRARTTRPRTQQELAAADLAEIAGEDVPHTPVGVPEAVNAPGHNIVVGDNPGLNRQIHEAVGASAKPDNMRRVYEFNAPDEAAMADLADQRRMEAVNARDEAAAALAQHDTNPPSPTTERPSVFPNAEIAGQWDRLMRGTDPFAAGVGSSEPMGLASVADAIESIDRGFYKDEATGVGLEPEEAHALRSYLLALLEGEINAAAQKAGKVTSARASQRFTHTLPDDFDVAGIQDATKLVMDDLAERVTWMGDKPTDGFVGIQYEPAAPGRRSTAAPGEPATPAILWRDRLADETVPSLGAELYVGRMENTARRIGNHRVARFLDSIFGARPEKLARTQSIENFRAEILKFADSETMQTKDIEKIDKVIEAAYSKWREHMESVKFGRYQVYRRISLMGPENINKLFTAAVDDVYAGRHPEWFTAMIGADKKPFDLWRRADNRLRNYIADSGVPLSVGLERVYGKAAGLGEGPGRWATVAYHTTRFLMDFRWLGLEAIEPAMLAFGRGGVKPILEAGSIRNTRVGKAAIERGLADTKQPLAFGVDAQKLAIRDYAHWAATSDVEQATGVRVRYLIREMAREQERPFKKVLTEMFETEPAFKRMIEELGDTPDEFLKRLDRDWQMAEHGTKMFATEAEAAAFFKPWEEAGIASPDEVQAWVDARRYTSHPAIEEQLRLTVGEPVMAAVWQRLAAINQGLFHELTSTFFGQENRSNIQRMANHPFLFWPISYQIKATKWLLRIMLENTAGVDTGAATGLAFQRTYDRHKERWATEPAYRDAFARNKNLLFLAGMIFPIVPTELGVSLSPWTRMLLGRVTNEPYDRQLGGFGFGPVYTNLNLLPRIIGEQTKAGARFEQMPGADFARQMFPLTYSRADPRDIGFEDKPTSQTTNEVLPFIPGTQAIPELPQTTQRYP